LGEGNENLETHRCHIAIQPTKLSRLIYQTSNLWWGTSFKRVEVGIFHFKNIGTSYNKAIENKWHMGLRVQMSLMLGNYKKKNFKWRRLNIASNI
jgi:hypothetical protein